MFISLFLITITFPYTIKTTGIGRILAPPRIVCVYIMCVSYMCTHTHTHLIAWWRRNSFPHFQDSESELWEVSSLLSVHSWATGGRGPLPGGRACVRAHHCSFRPGWSWRSVFWESRRPPPSSRSERAEFSRQVAFIIICVKTKKSLASVQFWRREAAQELD